MNVLTTIDFNTQTENLSLQDLRTHYSENKLSWILLSQKGFVPSSKIAASAMSKVSSSRPHYYAGIGSRQTPSAVLKEMERMASLLSSENYILRSGGAKGADSAFEKTAVHKEVYRPVDSEQWCLDLVAKFIPYDRPPLHRMKTYIQNLLGRNMKQILGNDGNSPIDFIICWTPLGIDDGGTGYAVRAANFFNIPVFNINNQHQAALLESLLSSSPLNTSVLRRERPSRGSKANSKGKVAEDIKEAVRDGIRVIDDFHKAGYGWLSNFEYVRVKYEGVVYPSVEHAFQAAKTIIAAERKKILEAATPGKAKRLGKKVTLRSDWDEIKVSIMRELLTRKFNVEKYKQLLLNTGDSEIIEGNYWHDNFWGICKCDRCKNRGLNNLGKLLMEIRTNLSSPPPERKYVEGHISHLEKNEVFVFGTNGQGFHGAGSAGMAQRGDFRNNWREDKEFLIAAGITRKPKPEEQQGHWSWFGVSRGPMVGKEGLSYGIQTVTKPGHKRSIPKDDLLNQFLDLGKEAKNHPDRRYLMVIKPGYNGYLLQEFKDLYSKWTELQNVPLNIWFPAEIKE